MSIRSQLLKQVHTNLQKHPEQRFGQAVFNTAHEFSPEIARDLQSRDIDPFYKEDKVSEFLEAFISAYDEENQ